LTLIVASIASISIFIIGFIIEAEGLDEVKPPFEVKREVAAAGDGFKISAEGIISSNSSPSYHQPQVTGKDNPYGKRVKERLTVELTGYSSTVDQTNSQPFITASGHRVRNGIVAANFLNFGTEIRIPEHFGDEVFVVKDRMNIRYSNPKNGSYDGYVDIWFPDRQSANNFGRVRGEIEILE